MVELVSVVRASIAEIYSTLEYEAENTKEKRVMRHGAGARRPNDGADATLFFRRSKL
jgi:hypothetical protein